MHDASPPQGNPDMLTRSLVLGSLLFCGAIFGFFYAWVCSTMWGLDSADPRVAIAAMQAMNACLPRPSSGRPSCWC